MLWGVGQGLTGGTLYEIDPSSGAVIASGPDDGQGAYEQDLAYAGGMLIVSDTYGNTAGSNYLDEYDPDTLAFLQRVPYGVTFASGLGGDGWRWPPGRLVLGERAGGRVDHPPDFDAVGSRRPVPEHRRGPDRALRHLREPGGDGQRSPRRPERVPRLRCPDSGQYDVRVFAAGGTSASTSSGRYGPVSAGVVGGEVFNDLNGNGTLDPGDPGLDNWEVDVTASDGTLVASQPTE